MSQSSNVPSSSQKLPWGKRKEHICLVHIEELIELHPGRPIDHVLQETAAKYSIPKSTLHNWYSHYKKYGEYPYETKAARKKLRKLYKKCIYTNIVTHAIVEAVGAIIEEHPEFFLDEIQQALAKNKKTLLSLSTIHRILTEKLGLSLQVCYESAKQRNEVERLRYKRALETLVSDPAQLVFVDETHKDRRASRRRRAWGKRNSGGVALKRWFKNTVRYTMIAALDINGFIAETIDCVIRDVPLSNQILTTVEEEELASNLIVALTVNQLL